MSLLFVSPPEGHAPAPQNGVLAMRAVHRAMADLRRGTPVLVGGPDGALVVAAAETVGAEGLRELMAVALGAPVLLLAPVRAAAVLSRPVSLSAPEQGAVALSLPEGLLTPQRLRGLADPTAELLLPEQPERVASPVLAAPALALAKLGRLLPALVAAPAREGVEAETQGLALVAAADIAAYPPSAATTLRPVAEARVPLEHVPEARIIAFAPPMAGLSIWLSWWVTRWASPLPAAHRSPVPIASASPATFWARCAVIAGRSCAAHCLR